MSNGWRSGGHLFGPAHRIASPRAWLQTGRVHAGVVRHDRLHLPRNVNLAPNRLLPGAGQPLTVAGVVNHTPPVPLKRAGANPTPRCAVRIAPHLRNAALGKGPRHAATGSDQETGALPD
jgi:hypothetical protein